MEHHGIDVSLIAHQFGGGGHKLASGFEVPGKIIETETGFAIA
jgi:nanoRNase/pAp phosphatase (c-di-AMP/oligoRNAs hydrolase)